LTTLSVEAEPVKFDFDANVQAGILVVAGGFEDRSLAFLEQVKKSNIKIEETVVLRYISQSDVNEKNYKSARRIASELTSQHVVDVEVHVDQSIESVRKIDAAIEAATSRIKDPSILIDVSGMTSLWAIGTLHAAITRDLFTSVIYSEADIYYPLKEQATKLVKQVQELDFAGAEEFLQSGSLKSIHVLPQFGGNLHPEREICLFILPGFEPNRAIGMVEGYAPSALVAFYGVSPRRDLAWRTGFSRQLHERFFAKWRLIERETSTLNVPRVLHDLEEVFRTVSTEYDVAIAPQCSKMQAVACYLMWRRHPEIQLVFSTPTRFHADRFSRGTGMTYVLSNIGRR
jgi:hypothetical protein